MLASVLLHAAAVAVLAWRSEHAGVGDLMPAPLEIVDEDRVELGIRQSNAVTMTWIGFESPTEHEAPLSVIDQAQLSKAMASGSSPAPEPPAPGESAGAEQAAAARPIGDWSELAPTISMPLDARRVRDVIQQMLEQAAIAAEARQTTVADAGGEAQVDGEAGPQTESAEENSDREADAVSRRRPVNVSPGKPVAAQGLEIKTTRPKWTGFMRATLRPRSPKVDVTFGPDGSVTLVRFVVENGRRQSSGFKDVDDVLLNSIYAWTATGVAIDELDPADPEAGVTITLRILLK